MSYEQKGNSGSLFKNTRKEKDTHPDYTGNGRVNGVDMWFSAWLKKDKNGNTYMSLAFKPKEERGDLREASGTKTKERREPAPIDDDIPF